MIGLARLGCGIVSNLNPKTEETKVLSQVFDLTGWANGLRFPSKRGLSMRQPALSDIRPTWADRYGG